MTWSVEQLAARVVADRDEDAGHVKLARGPRTVSRSRGRSTLSSPLTSITSVFHSTVIFGLAKARSCMILLARNSSRRCTMVTVVGEAGEERRLFDRGVAAADDGDVLVAEEEAVTGRARRDTVAERRFSPSHAERAVARTRREDHRRGPVVRPSASVTVLTRPVEVDRYDVVGEQLGAEALGLRAHVVHEVRAHDPVGEAGEVLDLGGGHERAAG